MFPLCFIVYLIIVFTFEPDWNALSFFYFFFYWLHTAASPVVKLHTPPGRWRFDRRAAHILPISISLPSPVFVIDCSWNTSSPLRPHSTKVAPTESRSAKLEEPRLWYKSRSNVSLHSWVVVLSRLNLYCEYVACHGRWFLPFFPACSVFHDLRT